MSTQEDTGVPHWLSRRREDLGVLDSSSTMAIIWLPPSFSHPAAEFPRPPGYSELSRPFRPQAAPVFCCGPLWPAFLPALLDSLCSLGTLAPLLKLRSWPAMPLLNVPSLLSLHSLKAHSRPGSSVISSKFSNPFHTHKKRYFVTLSLFFWSWEKHLASRRHDWR